MLVSLLFVALALRLAIMKDTSPPGLRIWCSETDHSLVLMLTFVLLFLLPDPSGMSIVIPIALVSLFGLRHIRSDIRALHVHPDPRSSAQRAGVRRFG